MHFFARGSFANVITCRTGYIYSIFLREKRDGSHRVVLNLKGLNEFVQGHHFKMETLDTAVRLMKPGGYVSYLDLEDAYYMLLINAPLIPSTF